MTAALWTLVALPIVAGVALLVAGRPARRVAAPVATGTAVATVLLAVLVAVGRPATSAPLLAGLPARPRVDGLSAVMAVTVATVTLAVVTYAAGELARDPSRWRFFGLLLVFAGAMLVTVTATTLPVLLAAWEVMGAASYALIGYRHTEPHRVRGGEVAFLTTRAADLGLYVAAGAALAAGVPGLRIDALSGAPGGWRDAIVAGTVLAALGKSAQLPFSFWLSRAMAGPSPVSALLHSATMVAAGAYLLLRTRPLLAAVDWAGPLVAWVGAATALVLGAVALAQRDLKQLLAASTCAQIGYMVLAAGTLDVAGGTLQLVAHAATKSLLFLCAGAWLTALGTKRLPDLYGAARRHRLVGVTFTVGAATLAGVPPLSIWVAKDEILAAAARTSAALYVVGLAGAVLGAAYAAVAVSIVWRRPRATATDAVEQRPEPVVRRMRIPLPPLAVVAAAAGVLALPVLGWRDLLGAVPEPAPSAGAMAVSGALAVATFVGVAAVSRYPAAPAVPRDWLGLERLATVAVARPVLRAARVLAAVDDRVVDGGIRATARSTSALASMVGAVVELRVDDAVRELAAAVRRAGRWARLPQTGQLHQYYAQAVVLLAALLALALVLGMG